MFHDVPTNLNNQNTAQKKCNQSREGDGGAMDINRLHTNLQAYFASRCSTHLKFGLFF